jgi:hypothetical protein
MWPILYSIDNFIFTIYCDITFLTGFLYCVHFFTDFRLILKHVLFLSNKESFVSLVQVITAHAGENLVKPKIF